MLVSVAIAVSAGATLPHETLYSPVQCEGSLTPYPERVNATQTPDTLIPVYISHVGRHGSRYPASPAHCRKLQEALENAREIGTITKLGLELLELTQNVIEASNGRWGALDSLGMAEQRAIATRMMRTFAPVFKEGTHIEAVSSYSPRAMMSMYSFVHQLDRMNNKLEFTTGTGRRFSYLLRPFDTDETYLAYRDEALWKGPYDEVYDKICPLTAITRILGRDYPFGDTEKARDLAITEYYVLAGLQAMQFPAQMKKYFTADEMNALWSCFNLRQYLQYSASTVSSAPADIASALVLDIIAKVDEALEKPDETAKVNLRFGHAETIMPLVALLRLGGCYYLTNYFDTVASHWQDFSIVPMAANLQFIIFRHTKSGKYFLRVDLNEQPVPLIPNDNRIYIPWGEARRYMTDCVPIYAQL